MPSLEQFLGNFPEDFGCFTYLIAGLTCITKANAIILKQYFAARTPGNFLLLYKVLTWPYCEYAIQASPPILSRVTWVLEIVQKLAVVFGKGIRQFFNGCIYSPLPIGGLVEV